ncbi:hypothetical protein F485_gp181 [Aeromonas phage CC2]|uniref:Uncharacterized protein n=1 Tax=Aeromonas phage CC2 TaxID=1204516 RepID=I6XKX7_9CAUD|nr:hypothetical protein F485_gp181 [Aeromonas phage CC2]AFN39149.1 hypothetical protein CC2_114 [Aeromonas phage CC2]
MWVIIEKLSRKPIRFTKEVWSYDGDTEVEIVPHNDFHNDSRIIVFDTIQSAEKVLDTGTLEFSYSSEHSCGFEFGPETHTVVSIVALN